MLVVTMNPLTLASQINHLGAVAHPTKLLEKKNLLQTLSQMYLYGKFHMQNIWKWVSVIQEIYASKYFFYSHKNGCSWKNQYVPTCKKLIRRAGSWSSFKHDPNSGNNVFKYGPTCHNMMPISAYENCRIFKCMCKCYRIKRRPTNTANMLKQCFKNYVLRLLLRQ
jgi:hypothetical protein